MAKNKVAYNAYVPETLEVMTNLGLLLVSVDRNDKPNVMTIGWGTIGTIWYKPMFCVLVRPSRYTHELIEITEDFTVNVPTKEIQDAVTYCGTQSGRDTDKFQEMQLTPTPGRQVRSPVIEQCPIQYECKVIHKNEILSQNLPADILETAYGNGDLHTVYFGQILATYADSEARNLLRPIYARSLIQESEESLLKIS